MKNARNAVLPNICDQRWDDMVVHTRKFTFFFLQHYLVSRRHPNIFLYSFPLLCKLHFLFRPTLVKIIYLLPLQDDMLNFEVLSLFPKAVLELSFQTLHTGQKRCHCMTTKHSFWRLTIDHSMVIFSDFKEPLRGRWRQMLWHQFIR